MLRSIRTRYGEINLNVALVCLTVLIAAGLIAWSLRSGAGPIDPSPPRVKVSAVAHEAAVAYFHELAQVYADLAEHPPATVREAAEKSQQVDEKLRAAFDARLKSVMQPALGDGSLDPAAARGLFGEMSRGFAAVK